MEMLSRKYTCSNLQYQEIVWFVEVAATRMILEELKRPEILNKEQLYALAYQVADAGTAFVARCNGEPVGALGALLVPNIYNPEIRTMAECFWYVLPEHRESRAGLLLLNEFDRVASEQADEATMSLLGTSPVNLKTYEKRGFTLAEYAFTKKYTEN